MPVIRLLFTIIAGVLLGGVVHLVSVLALPRIATQDAYSRLTPMTKENAVTALPLAEPSNAPMPFMDPAFAVAVCRYDLSGGPLKLTPKDFLGEVGLKVPAGEKGRMVIEQIATRPTAEINGLIGGYTGEGAKTVIPGQAALRRSWSETISPLR